MIERSRGMVLLKPITTESAITLKSIRLRALQDAPLAFGSTYATESKVSDLVWKERAAQWNNDRAMGYIAWDGDEACGMARCLLDTDDATTAQLISIWVAPTHRSGGIGRLLVNSLIDWARTRSAERLRLMVTSNNDGAIRFYEQLGFSKTGRTEPYPNDAALVEFEMIRPLKMTQVNESLSVEA